MSRETDSKDYRGWVLAISLAGVSGLSAIVLAAPLSVAERLTAVMVFLVGATMAVTFPSLRGIGARLVGLAVLSLALLPSLGAASSWMVLSVLILGFAAADILMLVRVLIALPLALAAAAFHAGHPISTLMITIWAASTVVALLTANQLRLVRSGVTSEVLAKKSPLSGRPSVGAKHVVERWMRPLSAIAAIMVVVPLSIGLGYSVKVSLPQFALRSNVGEISGPRLESHPGMAGSLDVGEPVNLSDDVVLRVESDKPNYWRAITYDTWDGRSWTSGGRWQSFEWAGGGLQPLSERQAPVTVPTAMSRQVFRTEKAGFDMLLGAPTVTGIWTPAASAQLADDGSVRLDTPLGAQALWTTDSKIAVVDPQILRDADTHTAPPDSALTRRYGSQPGVDPAVANLAQDITVGAPTTYDKVKALEAWMDSNITYDRDIPSLPSGKDAVTTLLFVSKKGFCEQIGSALVVMLRSLGIPARLAVGYVPGEFDSSSGEWISRGSDAHAWAEVYFRGVGWQGFDPTATVPLSGASEAEGRQTFSIRMGLIGAGLLGAMGLMGLIAVLRVVVKRILSSRNRDVHGALQHRFNRCGQLLGLEWSASTTLRERAADLQAAGLNGAALDEAVDRLSCIYYGTANLGDHGYLAETEGALLELEECTARLVATSD